MHTRVADQQAGHQAVFAGGCVRDEILGREPADYDIATSALPEQVEALFEKTLPIGKQFGIILVPSGDHRVRVYLPCVKRWPWFANSLVFPGKPFVTFQNQRIPRFLSIDPCKVLLQPFC